MLSHDRKEYSKTFFLTAGEGNPESEMPLGLLVSRVIEIATLHANALNIGYATLIEDKSSWVLSRVTVEMEKYPRINENYTLTTWVEDYNRHFSRRNIMVSDKDSNVLGYVRTIWMIINMETRQGVDLTKLDSLKDIASGRECPVESQRRMPAIVGGTSVDYEFKYSDCDFNRHVNTVRYIEQFLNQFPLERFDEYILHRFEIAFMHETHYGAKASFVFDDLNALDCHASIDVDGESHCRARFVFAPRTEKNW